LVAQKEAYDQKILVLHGEMCDLRVNMNLTTTIENFGSPQNKEKNGCGAEVGRIARKRKLDYLDYERERLNKKEVKGKTSKPTKGKAPESAHYIVAHCNIEVIEDFFNTSFVSWRDAWLLDTGATSHMTFQRDFFEDFIDNIDGIVYFTDKSSLKPSRMDTIGLKLPGLPGFLLRNVLYLLTLQGNLLSLVHIR
jgi:hypothetical protein